MFENVPGAIERLHSESESPKTAKLSLFFSLTGSAGFDPASDNLLGAPAPPSENPIAGEAFLTSSAGTEVAGVAFNDMEKLDNLGAGFGGGASPSAVARMRSAADGLDI